jgi:hypothetical protein
MEDDGPSLHNNPRPHNGNTTKTLAFVHKVATVEAVVTPKRTPASPPTISVCSSPLSVDVARGTCHPHSHADHIPLPHLPLLPLRPSHLILNTQIYPSTQIVFGFFFDPKMVLFRRFGTMD